jgi:hypothetical protein
MRRGVRAFLRCELRARCVLACAVRAFGCCPTSLVEVVWCSDGVHPCSSWLRRGLDRLQRSETMQAFNAAMTRPRRLWIKLCES